MKKSLFFLYDCQNFDNQIFNIYFIFPSQIYSGFPDL